MPGKGYATIGLKPSIVTKLQDMTDRYYPGMFLPSTLIIMMNEIDRGFYSVEEHDIKINFSGRYNSITIRSDIRYWFEKNYEELGDQYEKRYGTKCFSKFISYFIVNLFESKINAQNHVIRLKESDFDWLHQEYVKLRKNSNSKYDVQNFERFADVYINDLLGKIKAAKEILTT